MRLQEYLAQKKLSQAEFGALLSPPASQGLVSQWITGTTKVTLLRSVEIRSVTGGAVIEKDWAALYREIAERRHEEA